MESSILESYVAGVTSLRDIATKFNTNHHYVKRVLVENGIEVVRAKSKEFSDEHRKKIGDSKRGKPSKNKGTKASREHLYKNMAGHLRFDVSWEWLSQFEDIEKLMCLNACLTNREGRMDVDSEFYKEYVLKFYGCEQFNTLYDRWIESGKEAYKKPSIDHIVPRSSAGENNLENFQFLSWFENRCKNNIPQDVWNNMKQNIQEYFV